ncbi:MAG: class I SAM-dependent methyltransferase [Oligoflexia bacterium]|nr:class I SAM-dependent methyltransferase [Oligoflexia bacterium]
MKDIKHLGQVFTSKYIVKIMLSMRKNKGSILEPSSGNDSFLKELEKNAIGIEIDRNYCKDKRVLNMDFFKYPLTNKFNTIISNPPYVRHQDILDKTKCFLDYSLFDKRSNLYLFFIEKCIKHLKNNGELILITPRDFLKLTSSRKLNEKLYNEGSITDYIELGDKQVFEGFSPNCLIWRWEKNKKSKLTNKGDFFNCLNGQIWFGNRVKGTLGDCFNVKVGAVSGADKIFTNDKKGCTDFVCSETRNHKTTRRMIYNRKDKSLLKYKKELIARKIRKFNENNWWEWGRKYHEKEGERIYVNCKTRHKNPFFISEKKAYDGSVLALFPKENINLSKAVEKLNKTDWESLGFNCDGRLIFSQRCLSYAPIEL